MASSVDSRSEKSVSERNYFFDLNVKEKHFPYFFHNIMTDSIERTIALSGKVFGVACDTTQLVAEACRRHDVGPTAAAALGRALTGSLLLAALLKDDQSIQLKFEGNGPLGKIITEAGYNGWARGYIGSPQADVPLKNGLIDVTSGLGRAGFLTVTKKIDHDKTYSGTVQLYTSAIGEDIAFYLAESEQIPSVVSVGVHLEKDGTVKAAGGFLLQTLPPADESIVTQLEEQVQKIDSITSLLIAGNTPSDILSSLLADIPHKSTSQKELSFQCSCSHEKMEGALQTLSIDDISYLLEQEEEISVKCEFCNHKYIFETSFLEELKKEKDPNFQ